MSPATSLGRRPRPTAFGVVLGIVLFSLATALLWAGWSYWGSTVVARWQAKQKVAGYLASCPSVVGSTAVGAAANPSAGSQAGPASASPSVSPDADGSVVGTITLPSAQTWPIVAGVEPRSLNGAVAWYPQTAHPGQVGNMALAGYRIGNGAPFAQLLELNAGDQVQVRTCTSSFIYVVDVAPRDLTVQASASWVLNAVPGHPELVPTESLLTLTGNQDLLPTPDRSVGFAHLVATVPAPPGG